MCDGAAFATVAPLLFLLVSFHQPHLGLVAPDAPLLFLLVSFHQLLLSLCAPVVGLFYAFALMLKHSLPIQTMTRAIHY